MTAAVAAAVIPANERCTGFVAVAVRFPHDDPAAHRITRLHHKPDGALGGAPNTFDGQHKSWTEIRPACCPDSDPGARHYELSVPTALAHGAAPCDQPDCYGGAA
jgi:hypothetical protein